MPDERSVRNPVSETFNPSPFVAPVMLRDTMGRHLVRRADRAPGRWRAGAVRVPAQRVAAAKRIGPLLFSESDFHLTMRNPSALGLTRTKIFGGNPVSLRHRGGTLERKGQKTKGIECDVTISWDGPLPGTPRLLAGLPLAVR